MEKPTIKPEDLVARIGMTYHELYTQNDLLREALTEALTKAQTLTHKCEAYEIDNKDMGDRIQELSVYETLDKKQLLEENARLQNQHVENARTIEHLSNDVTELTHRIVALEGCLTKAHEAILSAQIIDESYKQQSYYDVSRSDAD